MSNLKVILGITIGISGQICASSVEETRESTATRTTRELTLEEARAQYKKGITLRLQDKESEAFAVIKQAADAGWKWEQYTLGSMYLGGIGTDMDIEKAFDYYEMCCDEIAEAANQMGAIYGGIFPQAYDYENLEKALEYYKKAADLGLPVGKDNYKRLQQNLGIS